MPDDLFSLEERVALVTGGNRGVGRTSALGFQRAGAQVTVTGRDRAQNARLSGALAHKGAVFALDVRDGEAVAATPDDLIGTAIFLATAASDEVLENTLAHGRLLLCTGFEKSVNDGTSEMESNGFFDAHDLPPWDT